MENINSFFTHGNLVDINVSMWTAQKTLTPEDLGIDSKEISAAFSLGKKTLIPNEVIASLKAIENKARTLLISFSFQFTFGGARFVPKKVFVEFAEAMEKLIVEFDRKADSLAANYVKYKLQMRNEYLNAAKEAYDRARSLITGFDVPEDVFINNFIERIEKAYPKAEEIRDKFHMEYSVFQVSLPDISQASYGDLIEESSKIKMMQDAYQKALYNKVNNFIESCTGELRVKCTTILKRFSDQLDCEDSKIIEPSLQSIRNMIDEYERMNFFGDDSFVSILKNFKQRCIDCYSARVIKNDKVVKETIRRELKRVLSMATDKAAINALIQKYRSGIGI